MKRVGNLWETLVSFPNLLRAALKARRGKRHRPNVARFEQELERELCRLQAELRQQIYRPGPYHTFILQETKPRLISAAPFRDRVVHHALCQVLEPIFEPAFVFDSYACRKGKGTHAAVDRFTSFARRYPYVLKCDVQKYFPSVDHGILEELLAHKIKDVRVLWLA
jgi:retron-type reverse transcriptase